MVSDWVSLRSVLHRVLCAPVVTVFGCARTAGAGTLFARAKKLLAWDPLRRNTAGTEWHLGFALADKKDPDNKIQFKRSDARGVPSMCVLPIWARTFSWCVPAGAYARGCEHTRLAPCTGNKPILYSRGNCPGETWLGGHSRAVYAAAPNGLCRGSGARLAEIRRALSRSLGRRGQLTSSQSQKMSLCI